MYKQNVHKTKRTKTKYLKQIIDRTVLLEIFDPTIGEVKFSKVKLSKLDSSRYKHDKMHKHGKFM